jgi:hypothetical protein
MTLQEAASMVREIGLPFSYYQFDENTAVAPPFICFYYPEDFDLKADGINYKKITSLVIELYTDSKDFASEAAVENVLRSHGLAWSRVETYIDSEKLYMVTFNTSIMIEED